MIFLSNRTHFLHGHNCWTTSTKLPQKNFCQKIFCHCFYCQKCFVELNHDIFKQLNSLFWMVMIVEQLQQSFHKRVFVRKIFFFFHCFLSEMFFRAPKFNFLVIKFILLAGHDCWKPLLKLQLYRAVLSSCPAKNS